MAAAEGRPMYVVLDWIERHCVIPSGFKVGRPFRLYRNQAEYLRNFYTVRADAVWDPANPVKAPAFVYRRGMEVGPQKALALATPVPTPGGWTTIAEVDVGDEVFTEVGAPIRVVAKSPIYMGPTFRVRFSDGAEIIASGDHEWAVERRTPSSTYVPERLTTSAMVERGLVDPHGASRFRVANARPLDLPAAALPVDPYTLGAWLGDGDSDSGRITGIDGEIFDRIEAAGYEVRRHPPKRVGVIGLGASLRSLGVLNDKHIPAAYLRASARQRFALLQGLMDTDGTAHPAKGACEFTTVLPALRDGMRELLWSLGIRHTCNEGESRLYGVAKRPRWRIQFAARSDVPVFSLARKRDRLPASGRPHAQYGHRRIVAIETVAPEPTQCLTVDSPTHLFLAGREMIPTGNCGKDPREAAQICVEGVGPALFAGFAGRDEGYACSAQGCLCGWEYAYDVGEPKGMRWSTPNIQIVGVSEDATGNTWDALRPMIQLGPLAQVIPHTGEELIRLPGAGECKIETVTSSADSRLGNPITFASMGEVGLWTKRNGMSKVAGNIRRGLAGMGGRSSATTNAWDPAEASYAQETWTAVHPEDPKQAPVDDVLIHYTPPPAHLSFTDKRDRRRIFQVVYPPEVRRENGGHIDLDAIEAETLELIIKNPADAERFFGNKLVKGGGRAFDVERFRSRAVARPKLVPPGALITLGFDGSKFHDHTALIGTEVASGYQWPLGIWRPEDHRGEIPAALVDAAVAMAFETWDVWRLYADPPYWDTTVAGWAGKYGKDRVVEWWTNRPRAMAYAVRSWDQAQEAGELSHCALSDEHCALFTEHVGNATRHETGWRDDGGSLWYVKKDGTNSPEKIDSVPAAVLSWEARNDAITAGALNVSEYFDSAYDVATPDEAPGRMWV